MEDDSNRDTQDEIRFSRSELNARREVLRARLAEAERTTAACRRELEAIEAVETLFAAPSSGAAGGRTIREMALEVLRAKAAPLAVKGIIDGIATRFGAHVVRTSLSPILKKMEGRGEVRHVGDRWEAATE